MHERIKSKTKTPITDRLSRRRRNVLRRLPRSVSDVGATEGNQRRRAQYFVIIVIVIFYSIVRSEYCFCSRRFLRGSRFPGLILFFRTVDPGNPETPPRTLQRRARGYTRTTRVSACTCDAPTTAMKSEKKK